MLKKLPITEARNKLTTLSKDFKQKSEIEAIAVTSRGKPVLAILPWEFYETLMETLEIMGDDKLRQELKQSLKELKAGKTIPWEEIKAEL